MKKCTVCFEEKDKNGFYKNGLRCKSCLSWLNKMNYARKIGKRIEVAMTNPNVFIPVINNVMNLKIMQGQPPQADKYYELIKAR